jgi:hypothetical protein
MQNATGAPIRRITSGSKKTPSSNNPASSRTPAILRIIDVLEIPTAGALMVPRLFDTSIGSGLSVAIAIVILGSPLETDPPPWCRRSSQIRLRESVPLCTSSAAGDPALEVAPREVNLDMLRQLHGCPVRDIPPAPLPDTLQESRMKGTTWNRTPTTTRRM